MRLFSLRFALPASIFLLLPFAAPAQDKSAPAPSKAVKAEGFAGESFVIENAISVFAMKADGTGYRERTLAVKIQSSAALTALSVVDVPFASATERVEFHYARARHADGSATETPVSGALEQPDPVTKDAPFYSDLKHEQLPIKNLKVGDTLEWEARIVRTRAEAPGHFWGHEEFVDDGAVVKKQVVELRVPAGKFVTVWTSPKSGVKAVESAAGEEKVYRWEWSQLKPNTGAAAEAEKKAKKTRLLTAEEEDEQENGKLPSVEWSTFRSWAEVGAWYRGLEGDRAVADEEIKAKVAELTAGKTTEEAKARAVYAYVSTQIRYIGVAFGVGRYQPHAAIDVLHNQYGDCKDKEMLLASMLSVLKVPTDAALIGAQVRFNADVASPGAFNHLITHAHVDGKVVWLDSTEEIAPYGMMASILRDKKALVVPEKGEAKIETTVATMPFEAIQTWNAKGILDKDGISESHIEVTFRGDDELALRAALRQIPAASYSEFAQGLFKNIGYAGTTSHPEFSRAEDTDEPLHLSVDYHREKGGNWDSLQMIPQLAPLPLPSFDEKDPPLGVVDLGYARSEISTAEMKLPEGWGVELPEAVHEKSPYATYDIAYRFDKGTVYAERRLVVLQQKVPNKDWKAYQKWRDSINEPYVQMKRVGVAAPSENRGKKISESDKAAANKLVIEAMASAKASDKKDFSAAETLLKQARKLDPNARRLWSEYGYIADFKHKYDEAIEDYRKELELYPEEYDRYDAIFRVQRIRKDTMGEEQTLRTWMKAQPENILPVASLAQLLLEDKLYTEAEVLGAKAVTLAPENSEEKEYSELRLGRIQLAAGEKAKAQETLVALLKVSEDPEILNDASYDLADAKLQLPLDEEKQHTALAKLDSETQVWTLDESPTTLMGRSHLLVASWDTMGWILYREGKVAESESWLEAAWRNNGSAEEKMHLSEVRKALGHEEKKDSNSQAQRTFPLGPAGGRKGTAEYRLLLSRNGIERAMPTGEKTLALGEDILKQAKLEKLFPDGSNAKLVRLGMLNCFSFICELVLEP